MTMYRTELKPLAVSYSERFPYPVRAAALRILGSGYEIGVALDDVLASPELLREVLRCLAFMAYGGFCDFYSGDSEAASWCVSREFGLCDDLANIDEHFGERTTQLNLTRPDPQQVELAAAREECAAITAAVSEFRAAQAQQVAKLAPGMIPDPRGVALLRWRNAQE